MLSHISHYEVFHAQHTGEKALKVVLSCTTLDQLKTAERYVRLYYRRYIHLPRFYMIMTTMQDAIKAKRRHIKALNTSGDKP